MSSPFWSCALPCVSLSLCIHGMVGWIDYYDSLLFIVIIWDSSTSTVTPFAQIFLCHIHKCPSSLLLCQTSCWTWMILFLCQLFLIFLRVTLSTPSRFPLLIIHILSQTFPKHMIWTRIPISDATTHFILIWKTNKKTLCIISGKWECIYSYRSSLSNRLRLP